MKWFGTKTKPNSISMEIRLKLYMDSYSYCLVHSKKKTISKSHRFHCFYLLKQFKPKIDINHLDFDWNKNILTFIREIFWVHKFIYQLFVLYLSIQSLHFLAIWIELFMAFAMTVLKFWITSFDPRTERLFRTIDLLTNRMIEWCWCWGIFKTDMPIKNAVLQ